MFIDLTLTVSKTLYDKVTGNEKMAAIGHLGTHFDVMDKVFPLEYLEREAVVFDVSDVKNRDIQIEDIDFSWIHKDMFVAFYTDFMSVAEYGTPKYFKEHPQLSNELIRALTDKKISIIGIDFAGVRRGKEHTPMDQQCADMGVFIVENLCNLSTLLNGEKVKTFTAHTYPIKFEGFTGLPCRVVAEM